MIAFLHHVTLLIWSSDPSRDVTLPPPGHGQSDGHRFHVDKFETYVHDALELMREYKSEVGEEKPFILFGHSMGGLLATHCMLEKPDLFTAGILSSPCLKVCFSAALICIKTKIIIRQIVDVKN